MPAKSKLQKRLMSWAYACKKKYVDNCPDNVKKIGNNMNIKQLRKFFEGIVYNTSKADKALLDNFLIWLGENNIEYFYSDENEQLEIFDEFVIKEDNLKIFRDYINKLNLEKMFESTDSSGATNVSTLGNINGQGPVRMAAQSINKFSDSIGSGDRFDNKIHHKKKKLDVDEFDVKLEDNDEDKNKEKSNKKNKKKMEESKFLTYSEFLNENRKDLIVLKRKYTEKNPEKHGYYTAPVRNKVLNFLEENEGIVTSEQLSEFLNLIAEERGGKLPSRTWFNKNTHLVKRKIDENGNINYHLTQKGKTIAKRIKDFESKMNMEIPDEVTDNDIETLDFESLKSKIINK